MKIKITNRELNTIEDIMNKIKRALDSDETISIKKELEEVIANNLLSITEEENGFLFEYNEEGIIELYNIMGDATINIIKPILTLYSQMDNFTAKWL